MTFGSCLDEEILPSGFCGPMTITSTARRPAPKDDRGGAVLVTWTPEIGPGSTSSPHAPPMEYEKMLASHIHSVNQWTRHWIST